MTQKGTMLAVFLLGSLAMAQSTIPSTYVLPSSAADTSKPGFVWRVHQVSAPQVNSNTRTEQQLVGQLGDNIADPNAQGIALAAAAPANPLTAPITFEIGTVINLSLGGAEYAGNFTPDDPFPGLPGLTGNSENVAAEILTWLDLPAGTVTLGVNSDDGFKMTLGGAAPTDQFSATKVGEFDGGRGAADTVFSFIVPQAGLYAARCTWEQGIGGANIEMFSVNSDTSRVLINDTLNGGIPAYRAVTVPTPAYVRSVSPSPGAVRVPSGTPIVVQLVEGATAINAATITLSLNGGSVTPTTSKSGGVWTISYTPTAPFAPGAQQNVVLGYMEGSSSRSFGWNFEALWISSGGNFATDFNSGTRPPGTILYGNARIDTSGGVGNSGVLKLTDAFSYGSWGWFSVEDFNGGGPVAAFHATFKLLIGGGEGADGFSFNFANDITDPPSSDAEEGTGTGLSVMFDTYDNGGGEAPAIDVKCGGSIIASMYGNLDLFRTGDFIDVDIVLAEAGTLDVTVSGTMVFSTLPVPFMPIPGRFLLGARTGALTDNHWVDNLAITAATPSYPYVSSFAPAGANIRWDAPITIVLQDVSTAQLKTSSVQLTLNGKAVTPKVSKSGGTTTVAYQPQLLPPGDNSVTLVYSDTKSQSHTFTRHLQVMQYLGPTGNLYETVLNRLTWPAAKVAAEQRTFLGHPGHLATITSFDEDLYLEFLRQGAHVGEDGQLWVGGYQIPGSIEPSEGWTWVNNEGPFPGYNYGPAYANWQYYPYYQPDNAYADKGGENYLAIGLSGMFGWNDDGYYANGRRDGTLSGYVVEYEAVSTVKIDIKPGDSLNPIQLSSNGKIPVAILSSPTFDASTLDPTTVRFGRTGTEAAPVSYTLTDVNGDNRKDLLCTFNTQDAGFTCDDKAGQLRAKFRDGLFSVKGSDSIHPLNCPQYSLSVLGIQDVNQLTDLILTVNPLAASLAAPTVSQHIQCKSLDLMGHVRWTANAQNVPLSPTPSNSTIAVLPFTDLKHMEPVKVQMDVPSGQGSSTLVLRGQGPVLFRPDLAITSINADSSVAAGIIANIPVSIEERNGDLGATADIYLMEGSNVRDWRQGVYLGPHQAATIVFSTSFSQMGTHELTVAIQNVTPGDYDLSNNTKSFTIEVTQPPAYYYAYYSWIQQEYAYAYGYDFWWYQTNYYNGKEESLYESLYVPVAWAFPLDSVTVSVSADGTAKSALKLSKLDPDFSYDDGYGNTSKTLLRELSPGFNLYIQSVTYSWGYQNSSATLQKYAGDYVYYSAYHDLYWGYDYVNSGTVNFGTFFDALSSIDIRMVVQSAGLEYGGTVNLPLYYYSWDYPPYEYHYPDGYFNIQTVYKGQQSYGYSSGYITP